MLAEVDVQGRLFGPTVSRSGFNIELERNPSPEEEEASRVELEKAVMEAPGYKAEGGKGRRIARLSQEEIDRLIEKMKLPRPVLPVVLPDGYLKRDPKRREEYLELRNFMVGEMQLLWDYNKKLLDQYNNVGYAEVLLDEENMWELY